MHTKRSAEALDAVLQLAFTVPNYLEMRERFPERPAPVHQIVGDARAARLLAFKMRSSLAKFGIDHANFLGALLGDQRRVELLALDVLRAIAAREEFPGATTTQVSNGLAIGDSLVDFICCAILEAVRAHGLHQPDALVVLLQHRLGLFGNAYADEWFYRLQRDTAACLIALHPRRSDRSIATEVGVQPKTIGRWKADPAFEELVALARAGVEREKGKSQV